MSVSWAKRNVPCCACIPRGSRQAIRTIINSLLFIDDDWLILLVVIEECQYSIHECLSFRISTYGFKRESQYNSLVVALVGHTGTQVVGRLYTNTLVDVDMVGKEWTKVSSGNCEGYVQTQCLCFGEEAEAIAEQIGTDNLLAGYTIAEIEAIEAEEEAERLAEEARLEAEAEAERAAAAAEEARRQKIIANTISGTDITYNPTMSVSDDDIWLMACIIDWEAGYQPYAGKLAVANVILNRVRSGHYPGTVTGVIYQRSQFSGVSDGAGNPSDRFAARLANGPRNTECMQAALEALSGVNNIGGYTSFRALYTVDVNNYSDFVIIGDHIFH